VANQIGRLVPSNVSTTRTIEPLLYTAAIVVPCQTTSVYPTPSTWVAKANAAVWGFASSAGTLTKAIGNAQVHISIGLGNGHILSTSPSR
jgi:hypothetical protein